MVLFFISCNSSGDNKTKAKDSSDVLMQGSDNLVPLAAVQVNSKELPSGIPVKGELGEAWQWTDKLGENILVISQVPPYDDKKNNIDEDEGQSADLYATQFRKNGTGYQEVWKITDGEKNCPFDITSGFIKGSTTVTDLDKDGIAEVTVQYSLACRSDVSPAYMKLVMFEDTSKYTLNGAMWLKASPADSFRVTEKDVNLEMIPRKKGEYEQVMQGFGRYETEKAFVNAPSSFLIHARNQWLRYVKESMQ
jgi:hypothetical protein